MDRFEELGERSETEDVVGKGKVLFDVPTNLIVVVEKYTVTNVGAH